MAQRTLGVMAQRTLGVMVQAFCRPWQARPLASTCLRTSAQEGRRLASTSSGLALPYTTLRKPLALNFNFLCLDTRAAFLKVFSGRNRHFSESPISRAVVPEMEYTEDEAAYMDFGESGDAIKRVTISDRHGQAYVDLRHFHQTGSISSLATPTKKGVRLSAEEFRELADHADAILDQLKARNVDEKYLDLGRGRRVKVRQFKGHHFVDIRKYYRLNADEDEDEYDEGDPEDWKPTKSGITFKVAQWELFIKALPKLSSTLKIVDEDKMTWGNDM